MTNNMTQRSISYEDQRCLLNISELLPKLLFEKISVKEQLHSKADPNLLLANAGNGVDAKL